MTVEITTKYTAKPEFSRSWWLQGVVILLNVGLYTTVPLIVAFFFLTIADFIYVMGSQAGIGDPVVPWVADVGMGLVLAATLTIAGISALLIEV